MSLSSIRPCSLYWPEASQVSKKNLKQNPLRPSHKTYMQNSELLALMGLSSGELTALAGMAIPMVFIGLSIAVGMMTVYFNFRRRKEMFALFHQERMAAIEKGVELPPLPEEFFREGGNQRWSPHHKLLVGLVLTFLGLGTACAMYFTGRGEATWWSLILIGLGMAYLLFYFAVDKKRAVLLDAEWAAQAAAKKEAAAASALRK
jgi:hypothetical protein